VNGAPEPLVSIDQVLRIPEAHYLYGTGQLVLRVTHIDPDLTLYPSLEWAGIRGVQLDEGGRTGSVRQVMVRVAWLRTQPTDAAPGDPPPPPAAANDASNISAVHPRLVGADRAAPPCSIPPARGTCHREWAPRTAPGPVMRAERATTTFPNKEKLT